MSRLTLRCARTCAHLRLPVTRILRKYGYPLNKREKAARTVLEQAEILSDGWEA